MKHENENVRMMKLVCFHWLICEIKNDVSFLFFILFVIDEECATMVTESLQHEQPVQPQHQSKTTTHHACSHHRVPLIGLMVMVMKPAMMMVMKMKMMAMGMVIKMNMVMDLGNQELPQTPAPPSKPCHTSVFPLEH